MKFFFFDTETNGLPRNYKAPVTDLENWPRLVQVGYIVTDETGKELKHRVWIVKPVDFEIPPEVAELHRVTQERAMREGIDIKIILAAVIDEAYHCDLIAGHNINFDLKILESESSRHGVTWHLSDHPTADSMLAGTDFCKLPGPYGYKWPKLHELYEAAFNEPLIDAHDAYIDIQATVKCFFHLVNEGFINLGRVLSLPENQVIEPPADEIEPTEPDPELMNQMQKTPKFYRDGNQIRFSFDEE